MSKSTYFKKKIENYINKKGKKELSEKLLFKSFKLAQKSSLKNLNRLLKLAILHSAPILKVKKLQKKKRKPKEFPFIVKKKIRVFLAVNSIIFHARSKNANFTSRFYQELFNSAAKNGEVLRNNNDTQEYSLRLKKYVHYRWLF